MVKDCHTEVDRVLGPQERVGQQEFSKCVHVEDVEEGLLEPQMDDHGNLNLGKTQGDGHRRQLLDDDDVHTVTDACEDRLGGGKSRPEDLASQGGGEGGQDRAGKFQVAFGEEEDGSCGPIVTDSRSTKIFNKTHQFIQIILRFFVGLEEAQPETQF